MGLKDQTLQLGSLAVENLERRLQNPGPQTFVDSAGRVSRAGFGSQTISRNEMAEIKEIRESGGIVAQLVHAKALMQFGTGAEFTAEREEVADWLHQAFNDLDNLLVDIGEDATWYPFSLAEIQETRGNLFDGITLVEPWTMEPEENDHGEIILWRQYLNGTEEAPTSPYEPNELAQFVLNKSSGRDNIGISEVKRAESEITQFRENHKAIGNAVEFASFMRRHVKVGREGAGVIPDRDLRRVRQLVENLQETTTLITGKDVEFDTLDNADFPFDKITEHDLRKLALALGLPLELANVGSDGLGSGMPADLRLTLFTRQARAAQRSLADQFIQQIVRPVLRDYSPYNHEQDVNLVFGDPVSDPEDKAEFINNVREDLSLNERREKLGYPKQDDEEADIPPALKEDEGGQDLPGLFEDAADKALDRHLADPNVHLTEFEDSLDYLFEDIIWADDATRNLVTFSERALPEFLKDNIRTAILSGALFSDFENVPSSDLLEMRTMFADQLTDEGWTLDEMTDAVQELEPQLDDDSAERIARTETQSVVNNGAEEGYKEMGLEDEGFKWVGPDDHRNATFDDVEICTEIKRRTNPDHGGEPVSLDGLADVIEEVHTELNVPTALRRWTPHINCRHRYVRHVE